MVLVKSREQVADELSRLQRDNESLQGKHKLHVELQQQEGFQMPDNVQVGDFRFLLQGRKKNNSQHFNRIQTFFM